MTEQEVEKFEKFAAQIEGLHVEISALSKKSQNDALNKFKLKFVNQLLNEANALLGEKYKPFNDFNQFVEEDMPSTSDVALMLTQYISCLEQLRSDNIEQSIGDWYWKIDGKRSVRKSKRPFMFVR